MMNRFLVSVVRLLRRPWRTVAEAKRLVQAYGIQSLEGIEGVAEQLGFPVEYVDLPAKVSGFACPMEDCTIIAVNRRRSLLHQRYTIAHELGHCLLHGRTPAVVSSRHADLEADCFAFVCLTLSLPSEQGMPPFVLHNLDIGRRVLPIVFYAESAYCLNRLADWLSRWFLTSNPQGA